MDVRFSITIRQSASLRSLIEAIPEQDWTPIPYWMEGAADVAETSYTPFQSKPDAAPVRLIVRRVKPTPGSQLALFATYSYHGCITDREGETLALEADHRRHAEIENAIRDLKYGVGLLPSGRFPAITHGLGPRKWDVDGHEYIDYVSGHGALILGHSHPAVADAVVEQMRRGTHLGACTDEELRWARAIMNLMPSIERVRFHSSGTEATLMAMRLARAYTGRNKIIKLQDHFHGWHDYAMAGSDRPAPGIPPEAWGSMVIVPAGDLDAVQQAMERDTDIAAIILEPTGAHYGQLPFDVPNYLLGLRQLCDQHSVVMIFDEVVTGFRASPGGAQVRYGVSPDLTTMAKIVAGALPGGAVGGKSDIVDMIAQRGDPEWDNTQRVYHPGTFNGNPLSAVAGATCLELIASEPINQNADAMADRLKAGLNDVFTRTEVSGHAYGIASMIHFTLADGDFDHEFGPDVNRRIKAAAATSAVSSIKRGLQNRGIDIMGRDALLVSATHHEADIDQTLSAFQATLAQVREEGLI